MSKLRFFFIILAFLTIFSACKSDDNYVPYAYVNFNVYLSDPQFYELNAVGNSVEINYEGYKGIIIYRKSTSEFAIYDKCCTNDPTNACEKVQKTEDNYTVKCDCCGSLFSLYDGYPLTGSGPAKLPLKEYNYSFDGDNTLSIFN